MLGEDEAVEGVVLAVGLNQLDVPLDRGNAVIGSRGMDVHIQNHGPCFSLREGKQPESDCARSVEKASLPRGARTTPCTY